MSGATISRRELFRRSGVLGSLLALPLLSPRTAEGQPCWRAGRPKVNAIRTSVTGRIRT